MLLLLCFSSLDNLLYLKLFKSTKTMGKTIAENTALLLSKKL